LPFFQAVYKYYGKNKPKNNKNGRRRCILNIIHKVQIWQQKYLPLPVKDTYINTVRSTDPAVERVPMGTAVLWLFW